MPVGDEALGRDELEEVVRRSGRGKGRGRPRRLKDEFLGVREADAARELCVAWHVGRQCWRISRGERREHREEEREGER